MRPFGHVVCRPTQPEAARPIPGGRGAALTVALLVAMAAGEAAGQPGGVFREVAPAGAVAGPDLSTVSDSITLRRRLVAIDFGQLTLPADTAVAIPGAAVAPSGVLTLNLFDDASFTGLVESVTPTFSGGYSLAGRLAGVEMGTYRIRPAAGGLHTVSQVDLSALPPPDAGSLTDLLPPGDPSAAIRRSSPSSFGADRGGSGVTEDGSRIDILMVYTPAARAREGGVDAIETLVDLFVTETNQAYAVSGVLQRLNVVGVASIDYIEISARDDFNHLKGTSDGYMDEVHQLRDQYAADLVHLLVDRGAGEYSFCGWAGWTSTSSGELVESGGFGVTGSDCGSVTFAHEIGHNGGLRHDRYEEADNPTTTYEPHISRYPYAHGYVNQRAFDEDVPPTSRWRTIMSYPTQCAASGFRCSWLFRFSSPNQFYAGDELGVPGEEQTMRVTGPADARRTLNETRHFVANFRVAPDNRSPVAARTLPDLTLHVGSRTVADMRGAFRDPDGDPLTYEATSSASSVAVVTVSGNTVALSPAGLGMTTVRVTATDPGGLSAAQSFTVVVSSANQPPEPVGTLAPLTLGADDPAMSVNVSGAFRDPDGDALTYGARSSVPGVAAVSVSRSVVTVMSVAEGTSVVTVTATDSGGSNSVATQTFTVTVGVANRPPEAVGVLAPLTIGLDEAAVTVDVSGAFRDPDGDALTYGATSSAPAVAAVTATGSVVTVTPVAEGTTTVTVTATDVSGSNTAATQAFRVMVPRPFTDPVITPGVTPVRAVHFTELRTRLDGVRASVGLGPYAWTDPLLTAGSTRVRLVHLLEMRRALAPVFAAKGRRPPFWTDAAPTAGSTPIRAVHLMELRAAVVALE